MKFLFLLPIIIAVVLYSVYLKEVPIHLNQDELGFSLNAYSIAKTGFDENNRFLPLYFWHLGVMWSTPIIVYLTALVLKILPLTEEVIRIPSVIIGSLDILLIYFITIKIFKRRLYGLIASLFLLLTPPHFIHSRLLLDNLYIVPFMLAWLLLMTIFLERKNLFVLFLATFCLGIGVHSYHASKVMMSLYFLMTLIYLIPEIKRQKMLIPTALLGFCIPLLPLIPWLSKYPDTLTDQVKYTGLYDTNLSPLEGIKTLLTWQNLISKASIFISYFSPNFLFFSGDLSLIHSTREVGIFLLSYMILLPLGIINILKEQSKRFGLFIIIGFLSSPIAPALIGNQYRVSKELVILPFAAIIATFGIKFLLSSDKKLIKIFCMILVMAMVFQFSYFLNDYFGDYKVRSYGWFNYNIPGSLETILREDNKKPIKSIYLDNQVYFIDRYWKFYLIKHKKEELLLKTLYINPKQVDATDLPSGSLLYFRFDHQPIFLPSNILSISEPDGSDSFFIIYAQ